MRGNKEYDFQQHIIEKLIATGYEYRKNTYDQTFAVDRDCLKRFLESTQKDELKKLQKRHPDVWRLSSGRQMMKCLNVARIMC